MIAWKLLLAASAATMATGLRGLLQHMDAMHRSDMKMDGAMTDAMHDMHQRSASTLADLEKTVATMEQMHLAHLKGMSK